MVECWKCGRNTEYVIDVAIVTGEPIYACREDDGGCGTMFKEESDR